MSVGSIEVQTVHAPAVHYAQRSRVKKGDTGHGWSQKQSADN